MVRWEVRQFTMCRYFYYTIFYSAKSDMNANCLVVAEPTVVCGAFQIETLYLIFLTHSYEIWREKTNKMQQLDVYY